MNWKSAISYSALGISFGVVAQITKSYAMLDEICNLSVPYLCILIGICLLLVGMHCLLFDSSVRLLPLKPTIILFILISVLCNGSVAWDGAFRDKTSSEIFFNLANTFDFTIIYAFLLFLPRLGKP